MDNFLDGFDNGKYNAAADTEKDAKPMKVSAGVKVTEHHTVVDKGYGRKKVIRFAIAGGLVLLLIGAGFLTLRAINQVSVQNFEGKTLAEVKVWATKNSIELDAQYAFDNDVAADTVISQALPAGEKIAKGNSLQLTVSSGANPDEAIAVPDFSAMTAAQIQSWIDENKLTNTKIAEENSATVDSGSFIKATFRDVTADKDNFKRKDFLTISVSKGPDTASGDTEMSDLSGMTLTEAESWASDNGVSLAVTTVTSKTIAAQKVISQGTAAGEIVPAGGSVNITVSGGEGIEVPRFADTAMAEAQSAYPAFAVTVKQRYSASMAYGKLISQSVSAGSCVLATDNKITVTYSLGKPYIGNLAGTSESELPAYFSNFTQKGASISYKVRYQDSDVAKGTVISTSKYSEYLSMSETITVVVSNGSKTSQRADNRTGSAATPADENAFNAA